VSALAAAMGFLACPHCGRALELDDRTARCATGHTFDVARQGYLNLLAGRRHPAGDTAGMVAARERFLAAGHFAAVAGAVADAVARAAAADGGIVELGAGPARYLAAALERLPGAVGVAVDASAPALRRAARAHPRIAAIGADAWGDLPLRDGAAAAVLCVFAPRGEEIARILAPGGALVVAAPTPRHLAELAGPLGLIGIDPRKRDRLAARFALVDERTVETTLGLDHAAVHDLVAMGPTARHADPAALAEAVAALPDPVQVTVSVTVSIHR
jgi:23S rRNA (guanine745-N1)-methyltransferase